jgi:hypothetical protein
MGTSSGNPGTFRHQKGVVALRRKAHTRNQAVAMKKGPRSWNRRDFNVATNGYFTILKPSGWFAAARLPGGYRYPTGRPKGNDLSSNPEQKFPDRPYSLETTMQYAIIKSSDYDQGLMRPALIVFAAAALTSILLWWIMRP